MKFSRRQVLQGIGGISLSLPVLESFGAVGRASAQTASSVDPYAIFLRQACGVAAEQRSPLSEAREPERFWPRTHGALTPENLEGRALDELVDYRDRLLVVDRVNMEWFDYGDGHANGAMQGLTARGPVVKGVGGESEADGESIDNYIGRKLNPGGRDSLFFYAGRDGGWLGGPCISYRGSGQRRSAYANPKQAFDAIVGTDTMTDSQALEALATRRKSVNDLVRAQLTALLGHPRISGADRDRLDLHFSNIRDLEVSLGCSLDQARAAELDGADAFFNSPDGDDTLRTLRLQMDVAAMAVACGYTRSVALQVGTGNDGHTRYHDEDGNPMENFHFISHRRLSHDDSGALIAGSDYLHHLVDRQFARSFKYLLDRLGAYELPDGGTLLERGASVWYNDNGNGPGHSAERIPIVLAGSAGGYFKQGEFVNLDSGERNHAKWLNTVATAVGVRKDDGGPLDDFGDPSLPRGLISELEA